MEALDCGLVNCAAVVKKDLGVDVSVVKGGGAAGGLGAGCVAFLRATLTSGAGLVMHYAGIEDHIRTADLVITGEGKIDAQTLQGKVVAAVAGLARRYEKPLIAFCGSNDVSPLQLKEAGIAAVFSVIDKAKDADDAMTRASSILTELARTAATDYVQNSNAIP